MIPAERAVRWAKVPGAGRTIAQACAKFGITESAYRKARKSLVPFTQDELVLAALSNERPLSIEALIEFVDWIDHARLSPAEMKAVLDRWIAKGLVVHNGADYELAGEWP